ncbi:hypothetical protein Tco_0250944 [Tanacetum coccineum]
MTIRDPTSRVPLKILDARLLLILSDQHFLVLVGDEGSVAANMLEGIGSSVGTVGGSTGARCSSSFPSSSSFSTSSSSLSSSDDSLS